LRPMANRSFSRIIRLQAAPTKRGEGQNEKKLFLSQRSLRAPR
jgi:hypothetical protein